MSAKFEAEKHYNSKCKLSRADVCHTHWYKADDEVIVSLLTFHLQAHTNDPVSRALSASIDVLDVSPKELRQLAEAMSRAAANLEAHIEQQKGGA